MALRAAPPRIAVARVASARIVSAPYRRGLCTVAPPPPPLVAVHETDAPKVKKVVLQKPPVNTFNLQMIETLHQTIRELEADESVTSIVLTSAYPKVFSAGLDLQVLMKPAESDFKHFWSSFEGLVETYYMSRLHTVAAISGSCPALGAVMALCSDYRLMVDDGKSKFGLNETSLGMVPPLWLSALTARTIGHRKGELHLGLSTMFSPRGAFEVLPKATEHARAASRIPAAARAAAKRDARRDIAAQCGPESVDRMAECVLGDEFQNTVAKIVEGLKARAKK
jgi:enoyl-CoA hydratase/carnithine racemase